jgi:hypothetical protein
MPWAAFCCLAVSGQPIRLGGNSCTWLANYTEPDIHGYAVSFE